MPSLFDLAAELKRFAAGEIARDALDAWIDGALGADPLGAAGDDAPLWEDSPDEERLFWRLLYLCETSDADEEGLRALARRLVD